MLEEWADPEGGVRLVPTTPYGIRLYQNGSTLGFHVDQARTHVISAIVHVGHRYDDDDEPWPIEIEDNDGTLHDVSLQPGEMLFYEVSERAIERSSERMGE